MSEPKRWTTPADLLAQLRRTWETGRLLQARLTGEALFPMALRLTRPEVRSLGERFQDVRAWIQALEQGSKTEQGFGYEIEWAEQNFREVGRNAMPVAIVVPSEDDALQLLGKRRDGERFRVICEETLSEFPALRAWLTKRPLKALEHAGDWPRLLAVLRWFREHPHSGLYLRQLDLAGVDTKFIETRRGLISELLDLVLPPEAIDASASGMKGFEQRYGLRSKPALIRFRLLDERQSIGGLQDLATPAEQLARLELPTTRVFITENEINGLAFPAMPESLVIFGLGYDIDRLRELEWLSSRRVYYWGDLDTHGFAILNHLRGMLPEVRSFLMDRATLLAHRDLWVRELTPHEGPLVRLTPDEEALYLDLAENRLGQQVRLEQERIGFGWLKRVLLGLP